MIPSLPWVIGITMVLHFTFARVGASLLPQMKFLTTPLTWEHILGLGFQDAAMYHIEASRTWFATSILPARDSLLLLQLTSLPLRDTIIVLKFVAGVRWEPTWTPRYQVPSPFGIHLRPSSTPHCQSLSFLLAQIVVDLCQFIFAPEALQKMLSTFWALSKLGGEPCKYRAVSSAKVWSLTKLPLGRVSPSTL